MCFIWILRHVCSLLKNGKEQFLYTLKCFVLYMYHLLKYLLNIILYNLIHFLGECVLNVEARRKLCCRFNLNLMDLGIFQCLLSKPNSLISLRLNSV